MNVAEFRSNLRAWLDENDLTPPPDDHSLDAHHAQHSRVLSALYDAGWMRWGWPESAGGLGGPVILRAVVGEEIVGRGLDEPGPYSMLEVLTPTLIDYARPELAAEMVPLLLSGRETWCQGFSEPGSGSDLASLSTRAEQRGDEWVVNGQKVWTSFAQYATRCVLLTRSGPPGTPKHEAITAFFVDMDTPGITVRPLRTMHGVDEFCEVYFDDVVVPADRMLGQPGDGWRLAMDLLPFERSTCFWQRIAYLYSRFDRLIAEVNDRGVQDGEDDAALGGAYLGLHTLRCRSRDTQYRLGAGIRLGPTRLSTRCCSRPPSSTCTTPRTICRPAQSNSTNHPGGLSICTRVRRRSTAAPRRYSATSSRAGCSIWGRSDGRRHLGR